MFRNQGINHFIQRTLHHLVQFIQGQVDAVIGDAPLGKIIGADPFRAVSTADKEFTGLRRFGLPRPAGNHSR